MIRFQLARAMHIATDKALNAIEALLDRVEIKLDKQFDKAVAEAERLQDKTLGREAVKVTQAYDRLEHYRGYVEELEYLADVQKDDFAEAAENATNLKAERIGSLFRGA